MLQKVTARSCCKQQQREGILGVRMWPLAPITECNNDDEEFRYTYAAICSPLLHAATARRNFGKHMWLSVRHCCMCTIEVVIGHRDGGWDRG